MIAPIHTINPKLHPLTGTVISSPGTNPGLHVAGGSGPGWEWSRVGVVQFDSIPPYLG